MTNAMGNFDWSTIDVVVLGRLPVYKLPPTYRLQSDPGNGCSGDPPGFPTYFTSSVYTQYGNNPGRGPSTVISHPELGIRALPDNYWDLPGFLTKLWRPLPIDHPRVQAWIAATCAHMAHCYADVERQEYGKPGTLIYPVPQWQISGLLAGVDNPDDPRWSPEYRAQLIIARETKLHDELTRAETIATIDNHKAVRTIRRYYPKWIPTDHPDRLGGRPGDWWERHDDQPAAEACNPPKWLGGHRTDGWCQFCGHTATAAEVQK